MSQTVAQGPAQLLSHQPESDTSNLQYLRAIVEDAEAAILMVDRDFTITYANRSSLQLLERHAPVFRSVWPDFDPRRMVGSSVDRFHRQPAHQRAIARDLSKMPFTTDIEVKGLVFALRVTAVLDEQGGYAGNTLEWRDVTELRRQDAQNADYAGQIAAIHKSQAVIEFDLEGRIQTANTNFLNTLGYRLEEIQGQHHSMFVRPEERSTPAYAQFWEALRAGRFQSGEFERIGKGGTEIWIQATYNPIVDRSGKPMKVVKFASDITNVKRMQREAAEMAERDLAAAAELKRKVDSMLSNVRAAAQGDLTQTVTVSGDDAIGAMGVGLGQLLADLRQSIGGIAETSNTLAGAAEEFAAVSDQMGKSASETSLLAGQASSSSEVVSANVQTVAAGTEEMSASIREIAKSAGEAARVATEAVEVAERTNHQIAKLGESSNQIGKVVKVITSIAQQTNLLALNATIEAARAGEAGKGFAVVANEVKELAKETARATEEIGQQVQSIQDDTGGAIRAIAQIREIIHTINSIQTNIAGAVEEQTATTNEMARNVSQAAAGSGEISDSISGVAQAAEAASGGAKECQRASAELARMSGELQRLVSRFRYC